MGLLDFMNTDEGMQGMGLLSAAGPSLTPTNLAGRFAQAGQNYQGMRKEAMQNKMLALQEMRAQQQFDMQKDAYYGSPGGNSIGAIAPPSMGVPMPGQAPNMMGQPSSMPPSMGANTPSTGMAQQSDLAAQLDRVGRLALAGIPGAKEQLEILKYKNDPQVYAPGSVSRDRITGQVTTIPTVSTDGKSSQLVPDASVPGGFRVIAPEGAIKTFGDFIDRGKDSDLVTVPDGKGGTRQMLGKDARTMLQGDPSPQPASAGASGQWLGQEPKGSFTGSPQDIMKSIASISDPQYRMEATRAMQNQIRASQNPQALQSQMPAMSSGGMAGYTPSAAELEANKATLLAPIATRQKVDEASATGQVANGIAYEKTLGETHRENTSMVMRNREIAPLLDKVTTGQFNQENMVHLGNYIKNSAIAPDWMKSYADKIAGGDVNAAKVLENQLAAAGISTMLATLNKEGSPNRAMFAQVASAQEGLKSGNTTLKDVFELQQRMYDNTNQETSSMLTAKKSGAYNPATWSQEYAGVRDAALQKPPAALPSSTVRTYNMQTGKFNK